MGRITAPQISIIAGLVDAGLISQLALEHSLKAYQPTDMPRTPMGMIAILGQLLSQAEAEQLIEAAHGDRFSTSADEIRVTQARLLWESGMTHRFPTFQEYLPGIPYPPAKDRNSVTLNLLTLVDRRLSTHLGQSEWLKNLLVTTSGPVRRGDDPHHSFGSISLKRSHQGGEARRDGVYWIRARAWTNDRPPTERLPNEVDTDVVEAMHVAKHYPAIFSCGSGQQHTVLIHGCGVSDKGQPSCTSSGIKLECGDDGRLRLDWRDIDEPRPTRRGAWSYGEMTRIAY